MLLRGKKLFFLLLAEGYQFIRTMTPFIFYRTNNFLRLSLMINKKKRRRDKREHRKFIYMNVYEQAFTSLHYLMNIHI